MENLLKFFMKIKRIHQTLSCNHPVSPVPGRNKSRCWRVWIIGEGHKGWRWTNAIDDRDNHPGGSEYQPQFPSLKPAFLNFHQLCQVTVSTDWQWRPIDLDNRVTVTSDWQFREIDSDDRLLVTTDWHRQLFDSDNRFIQMTTWQWWPRSIDYVDVWLFWMCCLELNSAHSYTRTNNRSHNKIYKCDRWSDVMSNFHQKCHASWLKQLSM